VKELYNERIKKALEDGKTSLIHGLAELIFGKAIADSSDAL
jgi:hypothetical protein